MTLYKPKYFKLHELIYPELFNKYQKSGRTDLLWGCMDDRVLMTCDSLRKFLGIPVTINNYAFGGNFTLSGLRPFDTDTGAELSQHKFGRACDLKFKSSKWTPEKLREYMKSAGCFETGFKSCTSIDALPFLFITRIEWATNKEMTWFHFDVGCNAPDDGSIGIIEVKI